MNRTNIIVTSLLCFATTFPASAAFQYSLDTWMGDLNEVIGQRPLSHVIIPGTHDSATYGISLDNVGLAIAQGGDITQWANLALPTVVLWSVAQTLTVEQQLLAGVRVFDIRVAWRDQKKFWGVFYDGAKDAFGVEQPEGVQGPKGAETYYFKNFYTWHGAYSVKLEDFINPIKDFIDKHPSEVVILKFGGFINMSDQKYKDHEALIKKTFGNLIAYKATPHSTLNELVAQNTRVIVGYDNAEHAGPFWAPDNFCGGTWPNKRTYPELLGFLKERTQDRLSPAGDTLAKCTGKLWNTSTEITPDGDMIKNSLNIFDPNRLKSLYEADKTIDKKAIIDYLRKNNINPNVVTTDFMNADLARMIIDLNLVIK